MLTGCGKFAGSLKGQPSGTETASGVENSEAEEPSEGSEKGQQIPSDSLNTFASKVAGNYRADLSDDESLFVTIANVNGNLYAFCGLAKGQEDGDITEDNIYSYWTEEIIEQEAGKFLDSSITSAQAGFVGFSDMSLFGKYWGAPELANVMLTDNGIKILTLQEKGDPLSVGSPELELQRDSNMTGHFANVTEFSSNLKLQDVPDEIEGLWKLEAGKAPMFVEIRKHEADGKAYFGIQLYSKAPGEEVKLMRGYLVKDQDGTMHAICKNICSETPIDWQFTYTKSDDNTLEIHTSESPFAGINPEVDLMILESVEKEEIPLVTLFAPDDVKAYKSDLTINAPDMTTRTLCPQMLASDDVENNGGYFVRIGSLIFFRYYPSENMPKLSGYDGQFLMDSEQCRNSAICYYDTVRKTVGLACVDGGYGPIYYCNGKFVTQCFNANDIYSEQLIMTYYPNGTGASYVREEGFCDLLGVSEFGDYVAFRDFHSDLVCFTDGYSYAQEYEHVSYEDIMFGAKFCNGKLISLTQNDESGYITVEMIDPVSQEKSMLGGFKPEKKHYGYPKLTNVFWNEGEVYVGIAWFDDQYILENYTVVKADTTSDKELEFVYDEYPECCKNGGIPYFYLNYADEVLVNNHGGDDVGLSGISSGDLIYYDSPLSATLVAKDYLQKNPFTAKKGESVTILQDAECVGGDVFVITAQATAKENADSADFDRYDGFEWKGYSYSRIPLSSVKNNGADYDEEKIELTTYNSWIPISIEGKSVVSEPQGPFAATTAQDAFNKVISLYSTALEENWDRDKAASEGLADAPWDNGWPQDFKNGGKGGYAFLDVNKDGTDELLIVNDNSLLAIYGYNGKEAVLSFNRAYRHEAFLYEDGMIQILFGTMNDAGEYWYRYHALSGNILPVVEKTYTPTNGDPKNVQCFVYSAELDPDEVDRLYKQGGMIPVWAWEWGDEITEKEFDGYTSKAKEVKMPKATAF